MIHSRCEARIKGVDQPKLAPKYAAAGPARKASLPEEVIAVVFSEYSEIPAWVAWREEIGRSGKPHKVTLLAGAWVALNGRVPTEPEATLWVRQHAEVIEMHGDAPDGDYMCLRIKSAFLDRIFASTKWTDWATALRKLDGALEPRDPARFGSAGKQRAIAIPAHHWWGEDSQPPPPGY